MQPTRTVIVVDDEAELLASIKTVLAHMLGREGVQILGASSPDAALELLKTVDVQNRVLVLSDYNLNARLNGSQLLAEVRRRVPEARRVLMSGYDEKTLPPDALEHTLDGFVRKPFDLQPFLGLLRGLLATPAPLTR